MGYILQRGSDGAFVADMLKSSTFYTRAMQEARVYETWEQAIVAQPLVSLEIPHTIRKETT
jgi:hypothetical protein